MSMRTRASILILALAASAALAQTTPAKTPAAVKPSAPVAAPAKSAAPGKTTEASKKAKPTAKKQSGKSADEPENEKVKASASSGTRRDPFVSPVQNRVTSSPCPTGKKCLVPGEVLLRGVVKYQHGMIAVVENAQRKTYSLRENDPVFNGYVLKITLDSIVFRETTLDRLGKSSSREVVRKLTVPAV